MVTTLTMMAPAAAPRALAVGGGETQWNPVELPCSAPCSFTGDNTGSGLAAFPVDVAVNGHATWWTFEATASTSHTARATSLAPSGWRNTLVLTDLDGTVLANDDDTFGRAAVVSAPLVAGNWYLLALAGHDESAQGTATITIETGTPDAPVDVTAAPRTGAALLAWTEPDGHGDSIVEYRVRVNGSTSYTAVPAPTRSTTIADLTIGTPVTFDVTAVNAHGESARSAPSASVIPSGATTTTVAFSPTSVVYPGTFDVTATVSAAVEVGEGVVTFWRNGTKVADVAVVHGRAALTGQVLSPGTYSFVANYRGSSFLEASSAVESIIVDKAAQVLTFAPLSDRPLTDAPFSVAPTSTGPVAITVVSSTTAVCTVRTKVVTLVTGGVCTLTANQAGNSSYTAATPVVRSFTVLDVPPTTTEPPTTTTEPPTTTTTTTTTEPPTTTTTTTSSTTTSTTTTEPTTTTSTTTTTTEPPSTTTEPTTTSTTTTTTEPPTTTSRTTTTEPTTTTTVAPPPAAVAMLTSFAPVPVAAPTRPLVAGQILAVRVVDLAGRVPATGVGAVSVVLTASRATAAGHLAAFPCGTRPVVSNLNFAPRRTTTVAALVAVDPLSGRICVSANRAVVVRVDLRGWTAAAGGYHAVTPVRVFDTRSSVGIRPVAGGRLAAGSVLRVRFTGFAGRVPSSGVAAVAIGVTVVGTTGAGELSVWNCGTRPRTATLHFSAADVVANLTVAAVHPSTGAVCFASTRTTHLVVDLDGWIETGHGYTASAPVRLVDTRPGSAAATPVKGAASPTHVLRLDVTSRVPSGTTTAVVNLTTIGSTAPGSVTMATCPVGRATPATAWFSPHRTAATTVLIDLSKSRTVCVTATSSVHVVVDLVGTFGAPPRA